MEPDTNHLWPIAPPVPQRNAFDLRFFERISSVRDEAKRSLHEVEFRDELSAADMKVCPYPGLRHGYLMNQAALRIIGRDWSKILAGMRFLVGQVTLQMFQHDPAVLIWARSLLPMFLPQYLLGGPVQVRVDVAIPTDVSGLFKVMLDVPTTIDLMLIKEWSTAPCVVRPFSPNTIAHYATNSGILNNSEWTCAGPPNHITRILSLLEPSDVESSEVTSLRDLIPAGEYDTFAVMKIRQYALSQAFQVCTAVVMERAFARIANYNGYWHSPGAHLTAYERGRRIALRLCEAEASATRVVNRFCDVASGPAPCAAQSEFRDTLVSAVACAQGGSGSELLDAQDKTETAFRRAVIATRREAREHHASCTWTRSPLDFSPLSDEDFPSQILRRLLEVT
jgi:hypothetical protein